MKNMYKFEVDYEKKNQVNVYNLFFKSWERKKHILNFYTNWQTSFIDWRFSYVMLKYGTLWTCKKLLINEKQPIKMLK